MGTGTKVTLAFLGGAVAGAAALALLNRGKLDFDYLKPLASELIDKGMEIKDTILAKVEEMKENLDSMATPSETQPESENAPIASQDA